MTTHLNESMSKLRDRKSCIQRTILSGLQVMFEILKEVQIPEKSLVHEQKGLARHKFQTYQGMSKVKHLEKNLHKVRMNKVYPHLVIFSYFLCLPHCHAYSYFACSSDFCKEFVLFTLILFLSIMFPLGLFICTLSSHLLMPKGHTQLHVSKAKQR